MERDVIYDRAKIIQVLKDLNVLVVSTDRIGSASHAEMSQEEYNAMFVRFFDEIGFFQKLTAARQILEEPFPYEASEGSMDELEREMQDLKFWGD